MGGYCRYRFDRSASCPFEPCYCAPSVVPDEASIEYSQMPSRRCVHMSAYYFCQKYSPQRIPERFSRCVTSVLHAASTTPEPMG